MPIRRIRAGCCASAGKLSAKSKTPSVRRTMFFLIWLLPVLTFCSSPYALCDYSSNHSIRSYQHVRRNRHADLLRRFEINDELELDRLLHGNVGGLCAFQDLVDKVSGAPP